MGLLTLLEVATMPVLQIIIISILGAFLASGYCNLLTPEARKHMNKIVFAVFTPALIFASLAKTVTLQDIISWWFMPINIGLTFLFGGFLGWILVKILKPEPHLEGLIIAACSTANMGNLVLIIVPAICNEDNTPFGEDKSVCRSIGLSYASFQMAVHSLYMWSCTYHLIYTSAERFKAVKDSYTAIPYKDLDANEKTCLLIAESQDPHTVKDKRRFKDKLYGVLHKILEELMAPPTISSIVGFIFGATPWLKNLIIGDVAPLRVFQDSLTLLGDGTIPCQTLILGGNLVQGLRNVKMKPLIIVGIVCIRFMILPVIGIGVVKAADELGFLAVDPLFQFVLMMQFAMPPAMHIGTMTQLFDVGTEECSIIFLWTYLAAVPALTVWLTVYLYILS